MQKLKLSLSFLLAFVFSFQLLAQAPQPLPIDPKVRYGKLDNGLTYYLRANAEPKNQADFYIAQKVGSILEDDNQSGLAHFLEHMAFNGTENFPDKNMLNYLESIGVKFGYNVNAYTSFDETVYNISNVPLVREGIIDSCILILHDWSSFISCKDEEIEKERSVIHEEWRTGQGAALRMYNVILPEIFPGNRYGKRLPIGDINIVDTFAPETLRAYYHKWYRPDLQGIVIVGDIDVDVIEQKIKKTFADIPAPVNPAFRSIYKVDNNETPLVSIASDPEATNINIQVMYKHDDLEDALKPTAVAIAMNYMRSVTISMLNQRFYEITQKANPPFVSAGAGDGDFAVAKTKKAFYVTANARENEIEKTMTAIVKETQRMHQFGFTAGEYDRARSNYLRAAETQYNEREKQRNNHYVDEYVDHFLDGGSISGIETEYALIQQIAPSISLEMLNQYAQQLVTDNNVVIVITGPKKDGLAYPSQEEVLAMYNKAKAEKVEAYEDKVSNEPLIAQKPKAGTVKKETNNTTLGVTEWTLSNGAKVVIKKTDFKDDQILFNAFSPGGTSLVPDKEIINILALNQVMTLGGVGAFSVTDLQKVLAGKRVSISPSIGNLSERMSGSCSPKDLETMLQLNYLFFTAPRMDQDAFESWKSRMKSALQNQDANPMTAFSDSMSRTLYGNNPRVKRLKADMIDQVSYQAIMDIYKDRFKDAGDFVFTFVGNIDPMTVRPLIEQYIASLPKVKRKETYKDTKVEIRKGQINNVFEKEMETPKATVYTTFSGKIPYTMENIIKMNFLKQILDLVYTETVREQEGGTYGVGVETGLSFFPEGRFQLLIGFDTDPAKQEKLLGIVRSELKNVAEKGPKAEDLNKVKEYTLKSYTERLRENGYWQSVLSTYYFEGMNPVAGYTDIVNGITTDNVKNFANELLKQNNEITVIMIGTAKK